MKTREAEVIKRGYRMTQIYYEYIKGRNRINGRGLSVGF
jgi:hypothetical protein